MPQSIQAPSGATFSERDIELVKSLGEVGFVKYSEKPFTLKSGVDSHFYVFGREDLTTNLGVLWDLGAKICERVAEHVKKSHDGRRLAFIGLPTAGTPLAQSAAQVEYAENLIGVPTVFYQMRSKKKTAHGAQAHRETWLIGKPDPKEEWIFLVDNVVTDGGTKFEMVELLIEDGLPAREFENIILVDRQQGALKRMKERGFKDPIVLFNLLDLAFVFGQLGIWPADVVEKAEKEIAAHQFK